MAKTRHLAMMKSIIFPYKHTSTILTQYGQFQENLFVYSIHLQDKYRSLRDSPDRGKDFPDMCWHFEVGNKPQKFHTPHPDCQKSYPIHTNIYSKFPIRTTLAGKLTKTK